MATSKRESGPGLAKPEAVRPDLKLTTRSHESTDDEARHKVARDGARGDHSDVAPSAHQDRCSVSVVVPLYNEGALVDTLLQRIHGALQPTTRTYEVIVVNDGSTDSTPALLDHHAAMHANVRVVHLARNFGLQGAVAAGLQEASGDAIVLMDGDLQDPPELIPRMIEEWERGADVVYTTKRSRTERGLVRIAFDAFHRLQPSVANVALPNGAGNFSLISRPVLDHINNLPEANRCLPGLRAWVGFKQVEVAFDRDARAAGDRRMTVSRLVKLALDAIFGFSYLPLKFITMIGFATLLLGFGLVVWVLVERFVSHTAVLGWPSLMTAVCLMGGAQLISVGILGEYIARIYDEVRRRPNFIVRSIVNGRADKKRDSDR